MHQKIQAFFRTRQGNDPLNQAITIAIITLLLLQLIFPLLSAILSFVTTALTIILLFRAFSKRSHKRMSENQRFEAIIQPLQKRLMLFLTRLRHIRTHKYYTCPQCQTTLRVPRKKGTILVQCPRCKYSFKTQS